MSRIVKYLSSVLTALLVITAISLGIYSNKNNLSNASNSNVISVQKETQSSTEVEEIKITIGNVGDILIHSPIFRSVYNSSTDSYDFNNIFKFCKL